ncbi:MAG: hypothetical protein IT371_08565 [Deltaproteobacteria bacterium]|nr:hypothetical protein [Deltaproteobacteria bacterium]
MHALLLAALVAAAPAAAVPEAPARLKPPARPIPLVVVLREPGITTFEQVAEEFQERVRAAVHVVAVRRDQQSSLVSWLEQVRPNLVFTIGQLGYDLVRKAKLPPVVHALAFDRQEPDDHGIHAHVAPQAVFEAFRAARPQLRMLAVLVGPTGQPLLPAAHAMASRMGLQLVELRASSPADAVRILRRMAPAVGGLWLPADLTLLTPQVVQYAVGLQFRRRIPLMGATLRHVQQGALFALDYAPDQIGRQAAAMVNRLLSSPARPDRRVGSGDGFGMLTGPYGVGSPRLGLNLGTAERIRVNLDLLRARASEVMQ